MTSREERGGGESEDADVEDGKGIQMSRFWREFGLEVYGTWWLCHASCRPDEGAASESGWNGCQATLDQRVSSFVAMMGLPSPLRFVIEI